MAVYRYRGQFYDVDRTPYEVDEEVAVDSETATFDVRWGGYRFRALRCFLVEGPALGELPVVPAEPESPTQPRYTPRIAIAVDLEAEDGAEGFGTEETSTIFTMLDAIAASNSDEASPTGFEPERGRVGL
jgi:hypothetical protein